jgi:hypothetical protein
LTLPIRAKALVVGDGSETKLKPKSLLADHVIVAWHTRSSPDEPLGLVIGSVLVTGPLQVTSKLQLAPTDGGDWKRNNAFGMLK